MTVIETIERLAPWLVLAFFGWLGLKYLQVAGRMLVRLEAIEGLLRNPAKNEWPAGLPIGTAAPDFQLPDLAGDRRSLRDYCGRRLLLVFFSPDCGYCMQLLPRLAELPTTESALPLPVILTSGEESLNRETFRDGNVSFPVLLAPATLSLQYRVQGTPAGYLIDEEGRIASDRAAGAEPLLELVSAPTAGSTGPGANGSERGKANKGLTHSKLIRDGLPAGTAAPAFRLPSASGGDDIELAYYQGRRVLLVLSDPECGPCDQIAERLEKLHRQRNGLEVLMVSRRDRELNARKIEKMGLTFPVALQKQWEISRLYGIFATPVAYLIDERGVIARDVAKGLDAISKLVDESVA